VLALVAVGVQAFIGRMVVQRDLDADLVSVHLFVSMVIVALLVLTAVHAISAATAPAPATAPAVPARWRGTLGAAAAVTLAVLLLGSYVHDLYVAGWPLVGGELFPELDDRYLAAHYAHRVLAALGFGVVVWLAVRAHRAGRPRAERVLLSTALASYSGNVVLGAVHVVTEVSSSAVVSAHLLLAAVAWAALVAATALASPRTWRPSRAGDLS
jgi:heme A synthase